ncbi:MAG: FAD-containing oxidoreductase [Alphaproteobacteria bacterium]|nr:FAD-containing oxidoreductase [Alphaproteobacteria bacterium]MBU1514032.1 FAD-containing oxidoreductase [Alphaproteobacteria bacterium]MBU2093028.1 FAD-containing oxidoreductase [Alphaproteobacteria bacterium]MBU2151769.1 FAD-containing oxidoreductase [Alphaproteobacteria bacterium]MBU2309411.1 FAD-containing oxidoreductase [Alphaproteobacteria bacterium]
MTRPFDAIVIGAGQAGPALAERLTKAGQTVAIVERKYLGGTCVNTGCMPTKALVASAKTAQVARRAADYGVVLTGEVAVDMARVRARAHQVTMNARNGLESWIGGMTGCELIRGQATFVGPHEIEVNGQRLTAPRIFINVGGRAVVPDFPGVGEVPHLNNTSILELDTLPRHLVVVGGSYIGLEFAQMYRRFGAQVTVVEKGPRLVGREDEDVSQAIREILEGEGITVRTGAECIGFKPHADGVEVGVDCNSGEPTVVGSHVLLAVGRQPNTDDLGLAAAGIEADARGYIKVDDQLRTTADGVWALGDCNGKGAFTHTSWNDYEIVAANLLDDDPRRVSDRIETYALYIDPPLGRCGMTETQARAAGKTVRVGKRPMTRVGRATEKGETQGFMKVVVDADTNAILGAAILGIEGDEAIHAILDTMAAKQPYTTLMRTMHIHPTVSELIPTVLGELKP